MKCRNIIYFSLLTFLIILRIDAAIADTIEDCGIISIEQGNTNYSTSNLFALDKFFAIASTGKIRLSTIENTNRSLSFLQASEHLLTSITWNSTIYLFTTTNRGFKIYRFNSTSDSPVISLVRDIPFRTIREDRELFSPLIDYTVQTNSNTIYFLGNFSLWKVNLNNLFSSNPLEKEEFLLPTEFETEKARPIALEPFEEGIDILYSEPNGAENNWYSFLYYSFPTNSLVNNMQLSSTIRKINSRNSAILESWFVYDTKTISSSTGTWINNSIAWPYDSFRFGDYLLVSFYDYGTFLYKNENLYCKMSSEAYRSAAIYEFEGIAGKEYILFGINNNGKLHRVAMLPKLPLIEIP